MSAVALITREFQIANYVEAGGVDRPGRRDCALGMASSGRDFAAGLVLMTAMTLVVFSLSEVVETRTAVRGVGSIIFICLHVTKV